MVRAFTAYADFTYLARRNVHTKETLDAIDDVINRFHTYRVVFEETGVRQNTKRATSFSLPRQHAMVHYRSHIENFGAPNGLCSSITESKHITAVKKPWRRSGRFKALQQMLLINQRNDKLAAARRDFSSRQMLIGSVLEWTTNRFLVTCAPLVDFNDLGLEDGEEAEPEDEEEGEVEGEQEDENAEGEELGDQECGAVDGPTLYNEVFLAKRKGECAIS